MERVEYKEYNFQDECFEVKGEADFIQFSLDTEIIDMASHIYTSAVLRLDDGSVLVVGAEQIRFIE